MNVMNLVLSLESHNYQFYGGDLKIIIIKFVIQLKCTFLEVIISLLYFQSGLQQMLKYLRLYYLLQPNICSATECN
jgi:hypothetical protein